MMKKLMDDENESLLTQSECTAPKNNREHDLPLFL